MAEPARKTLRSWGRASTTLSRTWRPRTADEARAALQAAGERGVLARGLGRSYGDVCLNDGGDVLDLTALRGIHRFDPDTGVLRCEAGVSYRDVMRLCVPRGWLPAVCPGTAMVTMGGAVANDVHGKNQHGAGTFGDHVDWLDLLLPDGSVRRVAPAADPELFAATVGGVGLTGVVLAMQIRLARVPSNAMERVERRVPDLDAFLEHLADPVPGFPYSVGWIDAATRGRGMGRGILELGRHADHGVREPPGVTVRVPFDFPRWVLNRHTVRAFNAGYFHRVPAGGRARTVHVGRFLFPLDALHDWNRMYGRPGVFQFQCAVPFADGRRALVRLMDEIVRSRGASFLAVIKSFGRPGRGMLSFPMPGFTLALDFPRRPQTRRLVERLQDVALEHGGRVYLAKDACLRPEQLAAMYPALERFRAVLGRVDPEGRMQSDLSRRLEVTPAPVHALA